MSTQTAHAAPRPRRWWRSLDDVFGCYLAARLAPSAPMGHALTLGVIGTVLAALGAIEMWNFGPNWYPVALAASALPSAWLGGFLHRLSHPR